MTSKITKEQVSTLIEHAKKYQTEYNKLDKHESEILRLTKKIEKISENLEALRTAEKILLDSIMEKQKITFDELAIETQRFVKFKAE